MIQLEIENAAAVRAAFTFRRTTLLSRWYDTTRKHAFRAVRVIQTKYRGAAATSATATRQGTGALRASYAQQTEKLPNGIETALGLMRLAAKGQALRYGFVHEEGATIRPTKAKRLAIPLPPIRSKSGIAPTPADFTDTFIIKGKFGGGIIARRLGKKGVIQPLFALRRQVVIPARPQGGAINAAMAEVQPQLTADLERDALAILAGEAK